MLSKERILAILLGAGIVPVIAVPVGMGWITNLSEFATRVVSGLVVAMMGAAAALWWRGGKKLSGAEAAREHGANPGIFHRHDRRSELEEAKGGLLRREAQSAQSKVFRVAPVDTLGGDTNAELQRKGATP